MVQRGSLEVLDRTARKNRDEEKGIRGQGKLSVR